MALLNAVGKWKSVEMPAEIFTQDGAAELQYLASFEEIDSYNFLSGSSQLRKLEQQKKKQSLKPAILKPADKSVTKKQQKENKLTAQSNPKNKPNEKAAAKKQSKESKLTGQSSTELEQNKEKQGPIVSKKKNKKVSDTENDSSPPVKKKKLKTNSSVEENEDGILVNPQDSLIQESIPKNKTPRELARMKIRHEPFKGEHSVCMKAWENILVPTPVIRALDEMGFTTPTPIQEKSLLPAIRDKLDILGAAETGSGKTLAFGIPIVEGLLSLEDDIKCLRALILTPTRELAIQVKGHISAILKYTDIRIASIIGGLSVQKQERLLKSKPEILVGTPGRVWGFLEHASGNDYLSNLEGLKYLVIDETDRMIEKGHFEELDHILTALQQRKTRAKRQTFVFSATLTFVHPVPKRPGQKVQQMSPQDKIGEEPSIRNMSLDNLINMTGLRKERKVIDITQSYGTAESLTEARINCESLMDKDASLYYFLSKYPGRTLVFTNSIDGSRRLHSLLLKCNMGPFLLHARMHQKQRLKNLENFTASTNGILLATDVAARGLDIKGIQHVVHYQVPKTAEVYVHRSGRTARASQKGLSVMLIDPTDALYYKRICRNLNRDTDLPVFPVTESVFNRLKERIRLATEWESLEHRIKKSATKESWFEKQARAAEMEFDPSSMGISSSRNEEERNSMRSRIKHLQDELRFSLKQSLPSENLVMTRYPTHENVLKSREVVSKDAEKSLSSATEERAKIKPSLIKGAVKMMERKNKKKKRVKRRKK